MKKLAEFEKQKEFLVCIDSDGTAIDSMTSKHTYCFGPAFVEVWGLEPYRDQALRDWNRINLHGTTRGKNRFITLLMILERYEGTLIFDNLTDLKNWVSAAPKFSNAALEEEIARTDSAILKKALAWSQLVNQKIAHLKEKRAFGGVKEFLEYAAPLADIAVVSSADAASIAHEWEKFSLVPYVSVMTAQEDGSKADILQKLLLLGYARGNVLMVGDAPPDLEAAASCGVHFYPVLPERETESWQALRSTYFAHFLGGTYSGDEGALQEEFLKA